MPQDYDSAYKAFYEYEFFGCRAIEYHRRFIFLPLPAVGEGRGEGSERSHGVSPSPLPSPTGGEGTKRKTRIMNGCFRDGTFQLKPR